MSAPVDTPHTSPLGSVDGHALQIDELKGTKPTEKIDLSDKGLGVASAIIIASCIKGNGVLKELKCAACPRSVCLPVSTLTRLSTHLQPHPRSIGHNELGPEGGAAIAEGLKGNSTLQLLE